MDRGMMSFVNTCKMFTEEELKKLWKLRYLTLIGVVSEFNDATPAMKFARYLAQTDRISG